MKAPAARWWHFGMGDILALLLASALSWPDVACQLLADAGTSWHLRLGEGIVQTHTLPYFNTYTQLGFGQTWIDWSWLADVALAFGYRWGGLHAVCMMTVAAEILFITMLWRSIAKRCDNVCVCLLLCAAVAALSLVHLLARPHIWAWTLCLAVYEQLDRRPSTFNWHPTRLLVLFVIWVNVHPSFVFGLLLAALMLTAQWWASKRSIDGPSHLSARKTVAVALGLVATSLCNPYSLLLHEQLLRLLARRHLLSVIDEYRSLDVHTMLGGMYLGLVLLGLWTLGTKPQPIWRLWTFVVAAYVGLLAQRNIPFGAALMAVTMAESLDHIWTDWRATKHNRYARRILRFAGTFADTPSDARVHLWVWFVWAGLVGAAINTGRDALYDMPKRAQLAPLTQTLLQYGVRGGVLCNAQWGAALGFASGGRIRPMIDDRFELADDTEIQALTRALGGLYGWQSYLSQHKIDWVILEADTALGELLGSTAHWHIAQRSKGATLWHRDLTIER